MYINLYYTYRCVIIISFVSMGINLNLSFDNYSLLHGCKRHTYQNKEHNTQHSDVRQSNFRMHRKRNGNTI